MHSFPPVFPRAFGLRIAHDSALLGVLQPPWLPLFEALLSQQVDRILYEYILGDRPASLLQSLVLIDRRPPSPAKLLPLPPPIKPQPGPSTPLHPQDQAQSSPTALQHPSVRRTANTMPTKTPSPSTPTTASSPAGKTREPVPTAARTPSS